MGMIEPLHAYFNNKFVGSNDWFSPDEIKIVHGIVSTKAGFRIACSGVLDARPE
jgi:hypothetical protein